MIFVHLLFEPWAVGAISDNGKHRVRNRFEHAGQRLDHVGDALSLDQSPNKENQRTIACADPLPKYTAAHRPEVVGIGAVVDYRGRPIDHQPVLEKRSRVVADRKETIYAVHHARPDTVVDATGRSVTKRVEEQLSAVCRNDYPSGKAGEPAR